MVSQIAVYHPQTCEVALLECGGEFFVGAYNRHLTHQNGEPPYSFVSGYYSSLEEGLEALENTPPDAF